jgi:hypothetical protein
VSDYIDIDSGGIFVRQKLEKLWRHKVSRNAVSNDWWQSYSKDVITLSTTTSIRRADKPLLIQIDIIPNYTSFYNLCQGGSIAYENWSVMAGVNVKENSGFVSQN